MGYFTVISDKKNFSCMEQTKSRIVLKNGECRADGSLQVKKLGDIVLNGSVFIDTEKEN